jgi:5-carboxymethyl-2-hydroxymuconate isomerase
MPHLTLEHSDNLPATVDVPAVLRRLHETLGALGPYRPAHIRSRAVARDTFVVGDGAPGAVFAHVEVAILSGRDPEVRRGTGESLLVVLREGFAAVYADRPCSLSVEVREMERATYARALNELADAP